jgi:hypothetical protein
MLAYEFTYVLLENFEKNQKKNFVVFIYYKLYYVYFS